MYYLLITTDTFHDDAFPLKIEAFNEFDALSCAYKYYGGKITVANFKNTINQGSISNAIEFFNQMTLGEKIIYFSKASEDSYFENISMIQ